MDILGAIALGTEKYQDGAKFTRLARSNPRVLVLEHNWRQVIVHASFQIFVMLILMYTGQFIFLDDIKGEGEGVEAFSLVNPPTSRKEERIKLDTIGFHAFILMNLFNSINCRVLDTAEHSEINVFKSLFKLKRNCPPTPAHSIYWAVLLGEFALQHFIILNSAPG